MRVALIADDLTSAADGAAPFRAAGLPARVALSAYGGPRLDGVIALDLDTRAGSETTAAKRTVEAATALAEADVLVKTVDSTLRGHLPAEIGAARAAGGRFTAVIAPAFPVEGRTTWNGVQSVAGRAVHETSFADDPGHPVRCSDLTRLLPGAVVVGTEQRGRLAALVGEVPYVIADAVSDRQLDEIVAAVPQMERVLWVGSPGLAAALARRLAGGGRLTTAPVPETDTGERTTTTKAARPGRPRVLLVVGSLNPASREQVSRFRSTGGATVCVTDEHSVRHAVLNLTERGAVVLHGPDQRDSGAAIPAMLAEVTAWLAAHREFDSLLLTGGETARTVLDALGTAAVDLVAEPEPGIPVGLLDRPHRLPLVLKAGGFGDRDALVRLSDLLTTTNFAR